MLLFIKLKHIRTWASTTRIFKEKHRTDKTYRSTDNTVNVPIQCVTCIAKYTPIQFSYVPDPKGLDIRHTYQVR